MLRSVIILSILGLGLVTSMQDVFALESQEKILVESPRLVNAFGNPVFEHVNVSQQVQIAADLTNAQVESQQFVFIVQITDESGVIISLKWITGSLVSAQSFNPALSWNPATQGSYTAKIFVWESLGKPIPLADTTEIVITAS